MQGATGDYSFHNGVLNLANAASKVLPTVSLVAVGLFLRKSARQASLLEADTERLALLGVPVTLVLSFVGSAKMGAASNYYFTVMTMLTLLSLPLLARSGHRALPSAFMLPASALMLYLVLGGALNLSPAAHALAERWTLWKESPNPRYSADQELNLPWLNPENRVFLPAFNYFSERERGRRHFEHGGIGGLIQQGHFAALLLRDTNGDHYDGAPLTAYEKVRSAGGATLYLRKPQSTSP